MRIKQHKANKRKVNQYICILMACSIMAGMTSFESHAAEEQTEQSTEWQTDAELTAQDEKICLGADGVDTYIEYEDTWTYTGASIEPEVYVTVDDVELYRDVDYTVSYENNIKCGEATMNISGIGNYSGSVQRYFTIQMQGATRNEGKDSVSTVPFPILVHWYDGENRDKKRPQSLTICLGNRTATLTEENFIGANAWEYIFEEWDIGDNDLSLDSQSVTALENIGYTVEWCRNYGYEYGGKIELRYYPEKTSVSAEIEWDDGDNKRNSRPREMYPESVDIKLMQTVDNETKDVTSTSLDGASGDWKCTFSDLWKNENGKKITYSVVGNYKGYDMTEVTGDATSGFKIKAKLKSQTLNVQINWDDAGEEAQRPDSITVNVGNNESIEVKKSDGWKCSTTYWRKDTDYVSLGGVSDYSYSLNESEDGENCTYTYTLTPKKSTISAKAIWEDNENLAGKRPDSVPITLYQKFESASEWTPYAEATLISDNNWTATFKNLPKSDINWDTWSTENYEYSIGVDGEFEGYSTAIDGYNVVLSYTAPLRVHLNWDDAEDKDGLRPNSVELIVAQNQTVQLKEENSWSYVIEQWNGKEKPTLLSIPTGYTVTSELKLTESGLEYQMTLSSAGSSDTVKNPLDEIRKEVIDAVNKIAEDDKKQIDNMPNLTDKEKEDLKFEIDKKVEDFKAGLDKIGTDSDTEYDIEKNKEQMSQDEKDTIKKIEQILDKATAIDEIERSVENETAVIEQLPNISSTEKDRIKEEIRVEADKAIEEITKAEDKETIDKAKNDGLLEIDKSSSIGQLEDKANGIWDKIDGSSLDEAEKEKLKKELAQIYQEGIVEVEAADTKSNVISVRDDYLLKMENIVVDKTVKTGDDTAIVGMMLLLCVSATALYVMLLLRRRSKRIQ